MTKICPLLNKKCIEDRCNFWIHVRGKHPQTGADIDYPDCAVKWLPVLLLDNTQQARQAGAAFESYRNEHNAATQAMNRLGDIANEARRLPAG